MSDIKMPTITLAQIFLDFLKIGALAWGGPVSQIETIRKYAVEEHKYLNSAEFKQLLGICQILPGPEAAELCIFIGKKLRGTLGGLLAGLGFFLPNLILILLFGWLYFKYSTTSSLVQSLLIGVRTAILAIIVFMGYKLVRNILEDGPRRLSIAVIALVLVFVTKIDQLLIMLFLGVVYFVWKLKRLPKISKKTEINYGVLALTGSDILLGLSIALSLFFVILKIGALSFGGANTVIPLLYQASVEDHQWVSKQVFLDGIAINEIIPGPLVMIASFIGYAVLGPLGALLGTIAIALPAFVIVLGFGSKLKTITEHPDIRVYLNGVLAAVMGILVSFTIKLTVDVLITPIAWLIFAIALFLLIRWRVHPGLVMGFGLATSLIQMFLQYRLY